VDFSTLPFIPKRVFTITGVPVGTTRGGHAHKFCKQFILCVEGQVTIDVSTEQIMYTSFLTPGMSLLLDEMTWLDGITFNAEGTVVAVFCSNEYDASDYIHDKDEYLKLL